MTRTTPRSTPSLAPFTRRPPTTLGAAIAAFVALGAAPARAATEPDVCGRGSYNRGAGTVPNECPGMERDGLLCYPYCRSGYTGVGPVCWQVCPTGYKDDGAFCRRDAHIVESDTSSCPWYNACGVDSDCNKCPAGYKDDGCFCRRDAHIFAKHTYGRGAGEPLKCGSGKENDAGLCYTPCRDGYAGAGFLCWERCPSDFPVSCGAHCATSSGACGDVVVTPARLVPSCTEPRTARACNGDAAHCARRYDAVTFAATHNAFSVTGGALGGHAIPGADNQTKAIHDQLRDGVRGLMIDVHKKSGEVRVCHGTCTGPDYGSFKSVLRAIRRFLDANPSETVTVMLEQDGVTVSEVGKVIRDAGLSPYVFTKTDCGGAWPTLAQLGKKVLFFSQEAADASEPLVMSYWDHAFENTYKAKALGDFETDASCAPDRGHAAGLFVMNHFLTPLGSAPLSGSFANGDSLRDHVARCARVAGRYPSFVAVDWYNEGALMDVVRTVNRARALDSASSRCGSAATGSSEVTGLASATAGAGAGGAGTTAAARGADPGARPPTASEPGGGAPGAPSPAAGDAPAAPSGPRAPAAGAPGAAFGSAPGAPAEVSGAAAGPGAGTAPGPSGDDDARSDDARRDAGDGGCSVSRGGGASGGAGMLAGLAGLLATLLRRRRSR